MDRIARSVIAVGGIGTIVAVGMVCAFLIWVVAPLFFPVSIKATDAQVALPINASASNVRHGKEQHNCWVFKLPKIFGNAELHFMHNGELIERTVRNSKSMPIHEAHRIAPDAASQVTGVVSLAGGLSWAVGDAGGNVFVWSLARKDAADPPDSGDGLQIVRTHAFANRSAAVTTLAAAKRGRLLAVGHADGRVRVYHVTTERKLLEFANDGPIDALEWSPKNDFLTVRIGSKATQHKLTMPHPDATLASMFLPVWYEGYAQPALVWQSSGGDAVETKLSLTPLIFGTIKATAYSMSFGAPVAFLAAIFTSQFLSSRARAIVKPTIEFMASLPSVVLGIFAALLVAPWVEHRLAPLLCSLYAAPFFLLLGAQLWQFLPDRVTLRWHGARFAGICAAALAGCAVASSLGPWLEGKLFDGNLLVWLDAHRSRSPSLHREPPGFAAWLFPVVPLATMTVAFVVHYWINPLPIFRGGGPGNRKALRHALKFTFAALATLSLTVLMAFVLGTTFDPRGTFVDTFDQRNALVVGFVMGFAVVPIIYTIADDALTAVPDSLKAASLGAGATQWQTTIRIVVPAALGGLFSAFTIGLGRAVGETMIVLMAAGNAPIIDWNIFNGFRTLSANVAVEIPEAVKDSTHYRTLFLSALVLFALTFAINTAAELVRRRFRSRVAQ